MKYCPETVLVQSAFVFASRKQDLAKVSRGCTSQIRDVIANTVNEVSNGLSYNGSKRTLLPAELSALHFKLHAWIYSIWKSQYGIPCSRYFSEFPQLPSYNTACYVAVVKAVHWENLMIESLLSCPKYHHTICLQEIVSTIIQEPDQEDFKLFTELFKIFLSASTINITIVDSDDGDDNCENGDSVVDDREPYSTAIILLNALKTMRKKIECPGLQMDIVISIIELISNLVFGSNVKGENDTAKSSINIPGNFEKIGFLDNFPSSEQIKKMGLDELSNLHSRICFDVGLQETREVSNISEERATKSPKVVMPALTKKAKVMVITLLELLYELFTKVWSETFHWSASCHGDECIHEMASHSLHPLHQWIIRLVTSLHRLKKVNVCDDVMGLLLRGLGAYVEQFATSLDKEVIAGVSSCSCDLNEGCMEEFTENPVVSSSAQFPSTRDQFLDAVWRVWEHLEGYESSMDWLLTAEEFYSEREWLDCIKTCALDICNKQHAIMMIDILCLHWQLIDSCNGDTAISFNIYEDIRDVFKKLFNQLPEADQAELIEYTYSMSMSLARDLQLISVLIHPLHIDTDTKRLQSEIRVTFNRLVDDEEFTRTLNAIASLALVSPKLVLSSAMMTAIQYGRVQIIGKVLQRLPILSQLPSPLANHPLLCSILHDQAAGLKSPQEISNLISFVSLLLEPFIPDAIRTTHKPLLSVSHLIRACAMPYLGRHDNKNGISSSTALLLLKSSLESIQPDMAAYGSFLQLDLIPIILYLSKMLHGCKVTWEGLTPVPTPSEILRTRSMVVEVLSVAIATAVKVQECGMVDLQTRVQWLCSKVKLLDWTVYLHMIPLIEATGLQTTPISVPAPMIDMFKLSVQWTPQPCSDYDPILALFECVSVSYSIAQQIGEALQEKALPECCSVEGLTYCLVKVMSHYSVGEVQRAVTTCNLMLQQATPRVPVSTTLSHILRDVVIRVASQYCSAWATPGIVGHVIKHYVSIVKDLCAKAVSDQQEKDDILGLVIQGTCQVMHHLHDDVAHPLFVLLLDLVTMVTPMIDIHDSVARIPQEVYRDTILQKLKML
ncbi:uncharacterized protein LOC5519400 [Nematostella vectensis]|uniref:uncharacterized protein LOC5519400 n=1 Tax=Nematostella vectensis TaxID=45351 RepID=UPI00207736E2|nr:uncharacterized protein LOC5519400 [Nematostella vectensis]